MSFTNASDEYWMEKLRRENCDEFNNLVRMHLSFVLDLNTDENEFVNGKYKLKKWRFVPFVKKSKIVNRGVMDGAPLTQEGICQVYQLIEYLSKEPNIWAEGIFRRTGSLARQQELRSLLNQGQALNLDDGRYSVHDCASVLKGFLAELPEPLLTDAHYPAHCQIAELCCNRAEQVPGTETRLLRTLQLLLLLLPTENRVLLRDVLQLLNATAKLESKNKMSADSLATLFTPHLLCPRRLSPESLHTDSQTLSGIVAFMIQRDVTLFEIPPKLAVDIRLHFTQANADRSPGPAVNTVYSFVDRERTARAHVGNSTETALAQLYTYIQGLPESASKRKYMKQFNRQNGNGTSLQIQESTLRSKSFGDSIKRHIFFHKAMKKNNDQLTRLRSSSEELLGSPNCVPGAHTQLFCSTTSDTESEDVSQKDEEWCHPSYRRFSESDLSSEGACWTGCLTSTPAVAPFGRELTPISLEERKSMSPITRSTRKMCRAMQETMMTPRSRKPVLLMSVANVHAIPKLELTPQSDNSSSSLKENEADDQETFLSSSTNSVNLTGESPIDASFSSRTDDYGYSHSDEHFTDDDILSGESKRNFVRKRTATPESCDAKIPKRYSLDKEPILKPNQYNSDGEPIMFETSF